MYTLGMVLMPFIHPITYNHYFTCNHANWCYTLCAPLCCYTLPNASATFTDTCMHKWHIHPACLTGSCHYTLSPSPPSSSPPSLLLLLLYAPPVLFLLPFPSLPQKWSGSRQPESAALLPTAFRLCIRVRTAIVYEKCGDLWQLQLCHCVRGPMYIRTWVILTCVCNRVGSAVCTLWNTTKPLFWSYRDIQLRFNAVSAQRGV